MTACSCTAVTVTCGNSPIARAWAGHRVSRIAGGSSEIMKEIIARAM